MANEITIGNTENAGRADSLPVVDDVTRENAASTAALRRVRFTSGEKVEIAAKKVFRLHARLFEELAK